MAAEFFAVQIGAEESGPDMAHVDADDEDGPDPQRQVAFYHLLGQREANGPGGPYWHSKNTEVDGAGKEPDVAHQVPSNWHR